MPRYDAVLFDFDNTLAWTTEAVWLRNLELARRHGRTLTRTQFKAAWGKPMHEFIRILHGDLADTDWQTEYGRLQKRFPAKECPGAAPALQLLRQNGVPLAILTSSNGVVVRRDLSVLPGVHPDDFFCIQAAEDTDAHKPSGAVFDPLRRQLEGRGLAKAVYVGDSLQDCLAALDAGLDFIGVTSGDTTHAAFTQAGATAVLPTLHTLPALVL
jgi:phosphoglycolate phosphatase-like HAD superfamily hydrolase